MSKARDLGNLLDTGGDVISSSLDNVTVDNSKISGMDASKLTGTIADARISTLTASKLTGALPAISGANLTGIVAGPTISASDPAIDTNPSGGVGTQWANSTSGEFYVCTDATTGENVWTNVGGGSGNISPIPPFHLTNASLYCFAPAGNTEGDSNLTSIDKNAFASDADSTDQGDVTQARRGNSCASSTTHGYVAGGYTGSVLVNTIDKFAMGSTADSTDVGDLTSGGQTGAGITSSTHGYVAGGTYPSTTRVGHRYSFASDGGGTAISDLISVARNYPVGGSSYTHGYVMGSSSGAPTTQIEKFAYADNVNTADVGDLVGAVSNAASHCEDGYMWASGQNGTAVDRIDKMSTTSDSDAVDSGSNLSVTLNGQACGASSSTYGYCMGGNRAGNHANVVDKWPFASSSTATDVGNLTLNREGITYVGCQL